MKSLYLQRTELSVAKCHLLLAAQIAHAEFVRIRDGLLELQAHEDAKKADQLIDKAFQLCEALTI